MSDSSSNEAPVPSNDPLKALRELANSPRVLNIANTQTTVELTRTGLLSNTSSTSIVDVRDLAENMMFDATRLVARLDQIEISPSQAGVGTDADRIAVTTVLRRGAATTFAFALVCIAGSRITGTVFLHPLLAWLLILASIGFYFMAKVKP